MNINKFDKVHRPIEKDDNSHVNNLFNLVNELDTQKLLFYTYQNNISFNVENIAS